MNLELLNFCLISIKKFNKNIDRNIYKVKYTIITVG